jgi:hypothetical protein
VFLRPKVHLGVSLPCRVSAVPSEKYNVMLTGETEDNYFSTLGKGFRGLKKMFEGVCFYRSNLLP